MTQAHQHTTPAYHGVLHILLHQIFIDHAVQL